MLNFGHTLGHAIEKKMNFELLHGECVALGCMAALFISCKMGNISKEEGERLLSESTHRTLTEAVDDISLGNFQTKLKKVILNLKEAYDDLNPNVDKFDVASTIINGSLNDLKMLDKAIQEFNSEETM